MFGTIVNALAIAAGSILGVSFKGGIPEKFNKTVMQAMALAVILIGLKSAFQTNNILLLIFSLAIGSVIGELLRIEDMLEKLGKWLETKFSRKSSGGISEGFVTASLVYCVGSMAIIGSLESGLTGNHQTLLAKSVIDGVSSVVFASSLGIGVLFSSVSVFLYQGFITVTSSFMKDLLIPSVTGEMSAVGGLLIAAIGINMLNLTKIKVGNMLPSIIIPLLYYTLRMTLKF
ncbi:MAG: DUF554 domain-containing protein [Ignavibacteria bacterium]|nr:DUF554 domain-containing protein [Ignavibacteria bacterium]MCU7514445.1 DUF554 domain-containing protein [Ignavibacteria bacterium]MCU7526244.1 DUF554 domain-containing protein [Ignavibacteria bacterium]